MKTNAVTGEDANWVSRTILGLKRRDPKALEDLYRRDQPLLHSFVHRILRNGCDTDEVIQEVFLRVWIRSASITDSCIALRPWIFAVARNLAVDRLRVQARLRQPPSLPDIRTEFPASDHSQFDLARIQSAIACLPERQRLVILAVYFEELTLLETSERMKRPLGTVKTWNRVALKTLRKTYRI